MKIAMILFLSSCLLFTSCMPYSYFNKSNKATLEGAGITPKKIQFYMDRRVELRREISSEDAKLFAGRIKFVKGKYINVVILKKFTPGVCEETHDNKMVVSFENGSGKNLTFDADQKSIVPTNVTITADKKKNNNKGLDVFTLVGESWAKQEGNYYTGKVMYDNIEYTLRFGTHHRVRYNAPGPYMPSLLIKKNSIRNILIERRTIRGKVLR